MKLLSNVLSEQTKAKIADDCVRLCRVVLSALFGEMSRALSDYSKSMTPKTPVICCDKSTIEENAAK